MNDKRTVAGYEVNLILSKDGKTIRRAGVLIGPTDAPGFRAKDGPEARKARQEAKAAVARELGIPPARVTVAARYNALTQDGTMAVRRDARKIIGAYET